MKKWGKRMGVSVLVVVALLAAAKLVVGTPKTPSVMMMTRATAA